MYNGQRWPIEDMDPQVFLNTVLVPNWPDLRGAGVRTIDSDNEIIYEFYKRAGEKG